MSWKIIEQLLQCGKTSWQELWEATGKPRVTTLTLQLNILAKAGLVDRYEVGRDLEGNPGTLTFDLSPTAKTIINDLLKAFE